MDSRIILKRADFSQNNIGRYVELNALTKNILAKQTQYDESSSEAAALNTFVEYLITNGYIGGSSPKFRVLLIPALAKTHDELLFNIADVDGNGYPVNMMASAEIEAENKIFMISTDESNRVVGISSTTPASVENNAAYERLGSAVGFTDSGAVPSGNAPGRTLFVYSTKALSTSYTDAIASYNGICSIYTSYLGVTYQQTIVGYKASALKGFLSVSYNNSINTFESTVSNNITLTEHENGAIPHNQGVEPSTSFRMKLGSSFSPKLTLAPFVKDSARHARWSILGVSNYISPSDMESLKSQVETLMTALHVTI